MPADGRNRWYGSIRILRDDSLGFSPWTFPWLPHVAIWDTSDRICVLSGGVQVLYLYLKRRRVLSACFTYTLRPDQLRRAVHELHGVRGGLQRWVVPALEWTQAELLGLRSPDHPGHELAPIIPELLVYCRDLPVAKAWKQRRLNIQRQWVEHLREHPEDVTKARAPWMLPEGLAR